MPLNLWCHRLSNMSDMIVMSPTACPTGHCLRCFQWYRCKEVEKCRKRITRFTLFSVFAYVTTKCLSAPKSWSRLGEAFVWKRRKPSTDWWLHSLLMTVTSINCTEESLYSNIRFCVSALSRSPKKGFRPTVGPIVDAIPIEELSNRRPVVSTRLGRHSTASSADLHRRHPTKPMVCTSPESAPLRPANGPMQSMVTTGTSSLIPSRTPVGSQSDRTSNLLCSTRTDQNLCLWPMITHNPSISYQSVEENYNRYKADSLKS